MFRRRFQSAAVALCQRYLCVRFHTGARPCRRRLARRPRSLFSPTPTTRISPHRTPLRRRFATSRPPTSSPFPSPPPRTSRGRSLSSPFGNRSKTNWSGFAGSKRSRWTFTIPSAAEFAPLGHKISALVVCRGVPLRIAHDPALPPTPCPSPSAPSSAPIKAESMPSSASSPPARRPSTRSSPIRSFKTPRPTTTSSPSRARLALGCPAVRGGLALVDLAVRAERTGSSAAPTSTSAASTPPAIAGSNPSPAKSINWALILL